MSVVSVKAVSDYRLKIILSNGKEGILDLAESIGHPKGPMIKPLQDIEFFNQVRIENGTITWPNGFDMCPDVVEQRLRMGWSLPPKVPV